MSSASGRPPVSLTFVGSSLLSWTSQIQLDSLTWAGEQLFLRPDRLFFATGAQFLDSRSKHWKYGNKKSSKIRKFLDRRCLQSKNLFLKFSWYLVIFLKILTNYASLLIKSEYFLYHWYIDTSESDGQKANIDAFNIIYIVSTVRVCPRILYRLDYRSIRALNQGLRKYPVSDLSLQSQFQGFPSRATPCRFTGSSPDSWVNSLPFRCNRSREDNHRWAAYGDHFVIDLLLFVPTYISQPHS